MELTYNSTYYNHTLVGGNKVKTIGIMANTSIAPCYKTIYILKYITLLVSWRIEEIGPKYLLVGIGMTDLCEVEGCDKPKRGNPSWCNMHYTRWIRHGDPLKKLNLRGEYDVCQVEGCNRMDIKARGYCVKHYARWKKHRDVSIVERDGGQGCKIDGCDRKHNAYGYCEMHYTRLRKYGNPLFIKRNFNRGKKCKIDTCNTPSRSNGYCTTHDHRMRRYNDPNRVKKWVSNLEMIAIAKLYQLGVHGYIFQFRYKDYFPEFKDDFRADFFILVGFLDLEVDGFYHRGREFNDLVRDLKVKNELNINTNRVKGTEVWQLRI